MWRRATRRASSISDESAGLLGSAGGIVKALPELGDGPFYVLNADTFWIDRAGSNLERLALAWDAARMDILMMLADPAHATGHSKGTDFVIDADGRLARSNNAPEGLIYAGAAILDPRIFAGRGRRAAVVQSLFRARHRCRPALRHGDGRPLDHGRHAGRHPACRAGDRRSDAAKVVTTERFPRVLSIPAGAPFLPTLADAVLAGTLVPEFAWDGAPLTLADTTIFVPTRRAARELRSVFAERLGGRSAILPSIRPLGEFDEDDAAFDADAGEIELAQPIAPLERLLALAPLVQRWKSRLPAHVAALFEEDVIVPASAADSIWLARDLAALIDEIETEDADWKKLGELASGNLAGWWQVTLDFLEIVTSHWPEALRERDRSNPAAHRNALIRMEAARLSRAPAIGPVIAAGSTGSIPATAELLSVIARLPNGAVVLPGLDLALDERSWSVIAAAVPHPSVFGHPQFGLAKLLRKIGLDRSRCRRDRRA